MEKLHHIIDKENDSLRKIYLEVIYNHFSNSRFINNHDSKDCAEAHAVIKTAISDKWRQLPNLKIKNIKNSSNIHVPPCENCQRFLGTTNNPGEFRLRFQFPITARKTYYEEVAEVLEDHRMAGLACLAKSISHVNSSSHPGINTLLNTVLSQLKSREDEKLRQSLAGNFRTSRGKGKKKVTYSLQAFHNT
ncbi:hypothetical protein [Hahella chejuensis]|uniref:hypothetical protein n=1 Tax=Hahella chejuensis TaxID=158327 RepID=UPI0005A0A0B3|nr:hypothetical protein [Hahella chejuensis]